MMPSIEPNEVGTTGLIWLFATYGYVLFRASNLISEGSELLLLVPSLAGLVGGVILPLLGAVPDGAIMLFSGMGDIETAQESLSVGIGALAGSTIMLLTIPWGLSVLAGSVGLRSDPNGVKTAIYARPKETDGPLMASGVAITEQIRNGSKIMIITIIPYFLIQGPAFFMKGTTSTIATGEKYWALLSFIICIAGFVGYLFLNIKASKEDQDKHHRTHVMIDLLKQGKISLKGAFINIIDTYDNEKSSSNDNGYGSVPSDDDCIPSQHVKEYLETVLVSTFNDYDNNNDGTLQISEIKRFLHDFNENASEAEVTTLFEKYDKNNNGDISFDEFVLGCYSFCKAAHASPSGHTHSITERDVAQHSRKCVLEEHGDGEEEDVPPEIASLPADEQQFAIKKMAFSMLGLGTFLVLMFADPMVDVMKEIAVRVNVSPFYVSFILAPLASNASEVIASQYYASKKTTKTITVSLSALQGAACMNNTFCLAIFMGLIYFRGLAWQYAAETISIIIVQLIIFAMTRGEVMSKLQGLLIILIFPLSIALVAGLEALGFD